jgi:hypothetical protein
LRKLRPFELGQYDVLSAGDGERNSLQTQSLAAAELLLAEGARSADNHVDLPAGSQIDDIEHGLRLARFERRVQVRIVFAAGQVLDERLQLLWTGSSRCSPDIAR